MSLSVDVRMRADGDAVLALRGDVDTTTAGILGTAVTAALASRPRQVCIDLGLVTFIDAAGIGALVAARRTAQQLGCRLSLANLTPLVHHTLRVMRLLDDFAVTTRPYLEARHY